MSRIQRIHLKQNRSRLLSVGRSGADLHLHACFATAPAEVLDAVAVFVRSPVPPEVRRRAVATLRQFAANQQQTTPRQPRVGGCAASAEERTLLQHLYARLNQERFADRLPSDIPLRISNRMSRRLGHAYLARRPDGVPYVVEIALSHHLMLPDNEAQRVETMLHEMAHAAAWLWDGSRGHDARWKAWARQAGCEPRACTAVRIQRRTD